MSGVVVTALTYYPDPAGAMLVVRGLHPDDLDGHHVWVPAAALADRRAEYGLAAGRDGTVQVLQAIVAEHYLRLRGAPLEPATVALPAALVAEVAKREGA